MTPVIINQCDEWQSYASFKLVGVFTNRQKMNDTILNLLEREKIEFNGNILKLNELNIQELSREVTYLHLEEVELNEDLS